MPLHVGVEQYGRTFYFTIGSGEFKSSVFEDRALIIPIESWCAATGTAVDVDGVREMLSGNVTLSSPSGAGWQGDIRFRATQVVRGALPGLLPGEPPAPGQTRQWKIELVRP
jgi:hypothetical protein